MRRGPLAALLFLVLPTAWAEGPGFDDSGVRVYYQPHNLWRNESGAFLGLREGRQVVLTYDFFAEGEGYSDCPENRGDRKRAADCERFREAVGEALGLWAQAAEKLVLRRRSSPSEPVNLWIAWTSEFPGRGPVARSIDDSRDAATPEPRGAAESFSGFARVAYPGRKKAFGALLFNERYCWHLDDGSVCPAPPPHPNGKVPEYKHDARLVALHEGGHALGFGHFTVPSIMGLSGGTGRYELTAYDREAVRRLYELVDASVPFE